MLIRSRLALASLCLGLITLTSCNLLVPGDSCQGLDKTQRTFHLTASQVTYGTPINVTYSPSFTDLNCTKNFTTLPKVVRLYGNELELAAGDLNQANTAALAFVAPASRFGAGATTVTLSATITIQGLTQPVYPAEAGDASLIILK